MSNQLTYAGASNKALAEQSLVMPQLNFLHVCPGRSRVERFTQKNPFLSLLNTAALAVMPLSTEHNLTYGATACLSLLRKCIFYRRNSALIKFPGFNTSH